MEIQSHHQMIVRFENRRAKKWGLHRQDEIGQERGMGSDYELEQALRAVDDFRRDLANVPADRVELMGQERRVQQVAHGIARALMKEVFERADVKQPEVTVNGVRWGNRRDSKAIYTTLFGDVEVVRGVFSRPGGGPVAVPLELRLGLVEGRYTPAVARALTRAKASMPAQEAAELLEQLGVAAVSVSTIHRIPQAIAARYEKLREQINEQLRADDHVPDGAVTAQVALDGVMVPQDGENTGARGRKTASPKAPRHETRYGPVGARGPANDDGIKGRAWHEGAVGTIAYFDSEGTRLRTVYLGRMPESKMATLADDLEDELTAALSKSPGLDVCFASDGDLHQWEILEQMALRMPHTAVGRVLFLLDFFHAAEYLTEAADLVYGTNSADSHATAAQWRETLKRAEDGAERVVKSLRYHRDEMAEGAKRERMQGIIDYLANHKSSGRLGYAQAQADNKPIGTGVTEAAAKTVVNVRMKRAGARFSQHGGQTVMTFRAAILSGRFDLLSSLLEESYKATIRTERAA